MTENIHVQHPDSELRDLKRWKAEAMLALNAIYKKSEEIGGNLGELSTERVLNRLGELEEENKDMKAKLERLIDILLESRKGDNKEFLCPSCDDGEMVVIGASPNGSEYYECYNCGHTESYP